MIAMICTTVQEEDDKQYMLWLYEKFKALMFYTAKKYVSDSMTCEDIVQESILKLIPKIDMLRTREDKVLAGYIVTTIRNAALNHLKQEEKQKRHLTLEEDEVAHLAAPEWSLDDALLIKEKSDCIFAALQQLPEAERLLLEGKYILEYSNEQLAKQRCCKPDSIRMKLTRARRHALTILREWKEESQ